MRSFASLHLFIRLLGVLVSEWTLPGLAVFYCGCCLLILFCRPCKTTYMNNTECFILGLLTMNSFQACLIFNNSIHSQFYTWSLLSSTYLPLLIVCFNLFRSKRLIRLKEKEINALCLICYSMDVCCCFKGRANIDNDMSFPDRMVHPNQYPGGAIYGSSERDALLHNRNCVLEPVY